MVIFAQMSGYIEAAALGWTSGGSARIYWVIPNMIYATINRRGVVVLVLEVVVKRGEAVAVAAADVLVVAAVEAAALADLAVAAVVVAVEVVVVA